MVVFAGFLAATMIAIIKFVCVFFYYYLGGGSVIVRIPKIESAFEYNNYRINFISGSSVC